MPVILNLTEYEAGLVVDALATGRAALMKQWGSVFEQEVYDDGMLLLSKDSVLENLDDNIAALGWVRKRLTSLVCCPFRQPRSFCSSSSARSFRNSTPPAPAPFRLCPSISGSPWSLRSQD